MGEYDLFILIADITMSATITVSPKPCKPVSESFKEVLCSVSSFHVTSAPASACGGQTYHSLEKLFFLVMHCIASTQAFRSLERDWPEHSVIMVSRGAVLHCLMLDWDEMTSYHGSFPSLYCPERGLEGDKVELIWLHSWNIQSSRKKFYRKADFIKHGANYKKIISDQNLAGTYSNCHLDLNEPKQSSL